jgi:phosphoglycerate dehydrogenase-like enzyme
VKLVLSLFGGHYENELERLRRDLPEVEFVVASGNDEVSREIVDADGFFGWLPRDAYLQAKRLKWIQSPSAGVEWVARVPELVESEVVVTNTRGAHAQTIAESAFAMLLFLTRGLGNCFAEQAKKTWNRPQEGVLRGISGLTMGVVGLGKIGSAVAQRAHGFDMRVIAIDAHDVPRADYVEEFFRPDGLGELLGKSDVVAVTAPITPVSRGMIGPSELARLKPSAYVIVVSRGGIVDQDALAKALIEGKLAGAGLDATDPEPLPADSPLWTAPNVVITPHCSGSSSQTTAIVWKIFEENVRRFAAGQELTNTVDKRRGY